MWRLSKPTSHGGNSVRSVFTLATATFITLIVAFLTTFLVTTTPVHADTGANWKNSAIQYKGASYQGPVSNVVVSQLNLPKGTIAYTYVDPDTSTDTAQSGSSNSSNSPPRQVHVIYFASGTDLKTANQGSYKTYTLVNATTFTNPSAATSVSIDPANYSQSQADPSSCAVPGGLGWIICPLSNNLATAMDYIYNLIKGFFVVQPPAVGNTHDDMYIAWNIARSIANVAFIIVFIIIIYSQITQMGLSNYGLKKLLPRLIVAAVLMNLSFYICTLAIDISNVLGYSVHDLFTSIRQTIFNINPGDPGSGDVWSFESMTGFILSGGTAALAAGVGIGSALLTTGGSVVGLVFLLLPVLLGLILAVLVVFVILAARQALIIILLIISPLAFVAYLLPNTEKLFGRWRELFMTMLVFFPAFSLVFGGSQLASAVIIQNASSINLILLGLIVQVAPLVITPILLRFSGNMLGKIAGIVNNPRKGLVDRTRNWANARAENEKYKKFNRLEQGMQSKSRFRRTMSRMDAAGRTARLLEYRKHRLEQDTSLGKAQYEAYTEKRDATTRRGQQIQIDTHAAKRDTEIYKKRMELALENLATGDREKTGKALAELNQLRLEADVTLGEAIRTIGGADVKNMRITKRYEEFGRHAMKHAQDSDLQLRAVEAATNIAKGIQTQNYAKAVEAKDELWSGNNEFQLVSMRNGVEIVYDQSGTLEVSLRRRAGGIHVRGEERALASAQAVVEEELNKMVKMIEDTSDIPAGQVGKLSEKLREATASNDIASMIAFTNKLAASNSAGIATLRDTLIDLDTDANADRLTTLKQYINVNSNVNAGAEDIGSWSRPDVVGKKLETFVNNKNMWLNLTPTAWSGQKLSSQFTAVKNGGLDMDMAKELVKDENFKNIKAPMRRVIQWAVNHESEGNSALQSAEFKQFVEDNEPTIKAQGNDDD